MFVKLSLVQTQCPVSGLLFWGGLAVLLLFVCLFVCWHEHLHNIFFKSECDLLSFWHSTQPSLCGDLDSNHWATAAPQTFMTRPMTPRRGHTFILTSTVVVVTVDLTDLSHDDSNRSWSYSEVYIYIYIYRRVSLVMQACVHWSFESQCFKLWHRSESRLKSTLLSIIHPVLLSLVELLHTAGIKGLSLRLSAVETLCYHRHSTRTFQPWPTSCTCQLRPGRSWSPSSHF